MSKNILVIVGSPTVQGATDILADAFIKGAREAEHTISRFHLGETKVNGCLHCNQCFIKGAPCVQEDGMQEIYDAFRKADVVVFASPVFFFSFSSQMKAVIDRLYAFGFSEGFRLPPKESVLLATAIDEHENNFSLMLDLYNRIFIEFLNWKDRGRITVGGFISKDDIENTDALEKARKLGFSL